MMRNTMTKLVQEYVKAYNSFDVEGMIQLLHRDVIFRNYSNGKVNVETRGISEFRQVAEQSKTLFTSREQKIKEISFSSEVAEVLIDYIGVLAIDLPNGLKVGERINLEGKSIFHFCNGKISIIEDYS